MNIARVPPLFGTIMQSSNEFHLQPLLCQKPNWIWDVRQKEAEHCLDSAKFSIMWSRFTSARHEFIYPGYSAIVHLAKSAMIFKFTMKLINIHIDQMSDTSSACVFTSILYLASQDVMTKVYSKYFLRYPKCFTEISQVCLLRYPKCAY